jgi:hypothetical protein
VSKGFDGNSLFNFVVFHRVAAVVRAESFVDALAELFLSSSMMPQSAMHSE